MASNTKILVVGKTYDGQVPVTDVSDALRDEYVFPPKSCMEERRTITKHNNYFWANMLLR